MNPYFLNVDFELASSRDLSLVLKELTGKVEILLDDKVGDEYRLNFEIYTDSSYSSLQNKIELFLGVFADLSDVAKSDILHCHKKIIDIGYNCGTSGWLYNNIPAELVKKIANISFDLNISIYANID